MRRLVTLTIALAAVAGAATFATVHRAQGSSDYKFDVIFDDARGLIPGQLVKIAGAKAGTISDVTLTPDFKARISATIEGRFRPFHQDATCTIRPEGLIAENYVDCDPGSLGSPSLQPSGGHPPTVPVKNTTEPVSLLDLFNTFNLPTRQRFMVIIDELGIGTSGRGKDFNDVLRRANPALALARQVIAILARQKSQLATLVDATNTIAAEAAGHTANLQNFLDRAAALSTTTAAHTGNLSLGINRLPGLLAAAQPALKDLDTVAVNGTPLVQQIHAAVPSLNRVASDFGPFVAAARPALAKLGTTLARAIPAIQDSVPLINTIRVYAHNSLPSTELMGRLFSNLQRHGFVENLLSSFYYFAAVAARYDATSHIAPAFLLDVNGGACNQYATVPVPGCTANWHEAPYSPSSTGAGAAHPQGSAATPTAPSRTASATRQPLVRGLLGQTQRLTRKLISKLLRGRHLTPAALSQLESALQGDQQSSDQTLQSLVSYLVK